MVSKLTFFNREFIYYVCTMRVEKNYILNCKNVDKDRLLLDYPLKTTVLP